MITTQTPSSIRIADPVRGIAAGALAGLVASALMDGFQALVADAFPKTDAPPATEEAADAVTRAVTGAPLPEDRKAGGGIAVHYAFGILIGAAYGGLAERWPGVTRGGGSLFGSATALVFDEIATPMLGLAPPPERVPAALHGFGLASHLVFGVTTEALRRLLRGGRFAAPARRRPFTSAAQGPMRLRWTKPCLAMPPATLPNIR